MDGLHLDRMKERFALAPTTLETFERLTRGNDNLVIANMRGGAGALLTALAAERINCPVLLITGTLERAEALADGMGFFGANAMLFPALETLPFEEAEPALNIAAQRSAVLAELAARVAGNPNPKPFLIVAPADALMHRLLPAEKLADLHLDLEWGQQIEIDALTKKLVEMGYRREAMVESPGEFSVRGTIVDVYPAEAETPWRLDFFGEEIESIRPFDPATQRSLPTKDETEKIRILPRANLGPSMEHLDSGGKLGALFDLLPKNTLLILDGPSRINQRLDYFDEVARRHWEEIRAPHHEAEPSFFLRRNLEPSAWVLNADEARAGIEKVRRMLWTDLSAEGEDAAKFSSAPISIGAQSFETIPPNFNNFLDLIEEKRFSDYLIAVVCDNAGQVQRLDELLAERRIPAARLDSADGKPVIQPSIHDVALIVGDLHEGFIFPAAKLLLLTDREIFGRYKRRRVYRKTHPGKAIKSPTEISRGDFVVHLDHGIGRFEGIRRQSIEGAMTEFLELVYQDDNRLLVPIDKLHLVQKYASAEGKEPVLDRLGKKAWHRRKAKSQEAIRILAGELLQLYARREAAERHAYGPDTVWQREFEAAFLYEETPDQHKAIGEVMSDLHRAKPMDRLICGDVGFGKTEVAIRAAFKVLCEGHQVAVLAPTTLLTQQHDRTFRERLADFPFRVAQLSRFSSPAEQKQTLTDLAKGDVHLVVGTHRLLSNDVRFHDLGLLIVDEEQRFGVAQKERIKNLRASVDILTLTATPIPRTLHMALAKLRDLSVILTPPANRLPIKTRTIYFEKDPIEEAILRELNRGGQVYFVHNRIETIEEVAQSVREIVPHARIAVAHGRMDEDDLENIMINFIAGQYDILLSTTIIENGLDIPNVNTIIINRADAMGLAQLYQLRGRVGRDVRQAYAYLIMPRGRPISDAAVKRLAALEEFTELGMGFSVAMRDMEIRGAGNILGREQHGAIADVGFEMYCQLLEESVLNLRGEGPSEALWATEVKWPVDQWVPEEYVPVETQRIGFYRDLASARDRYEVERIRDELLDRYGDLPAETVNLINAFRVKTALSPWRVESVRQGADGSVRIVCGEGIGQLAEALQRLSGGSEWISRIERRQDDVLALHSRGKKESSERILDLLARFLADLPIPAGSCG